MTITTPEELGTALDLNLGESITGEVAADEARKLRERAEKAEAAVVRMALIHGPFHTCEHGCPPEDAAICDHETCCKDCMAVWPCPTIEALGGTS